MNLTNELRAARRNRLVLLALWFIFYATFTLFHPPLLDDADSVHAEVAREMLTRHDFVTLYANGIRYLEKAPLFYWLMALSMRLFGATTAASRLPLTLTIAALTLLAESFGRRAFSLRAGFYAGLITLSSFGIFIFSRINLPDVLVCLLLIAALYAYFLTINQPAPSRWLCYAFDAACALDVLTKGLIGIVFPVAIVAAHMLLTLGWRGTLRRLKQSHPITSTCILFAIAAPWHILIALANPTQGHPGGVSFTAGHWQVPLPTDGNVHGWAWFYFVNEQVLRYLNLRVPRDYDTVPLWLFLGLIFVWLMPWSAFLPSAIKRAWVPLLRLRNPHLLSQEDRTHLLLLVWAVLPLLFFTFSTRQEYYVLPSLPPLILLISRTLATPARLPVLTQPRGKMWAGAFDPSFLLFVLGTAAAAITMVFLLRTKAPTIHTDLATLLQQNPADYALSFGHFLDLNAQALGLFRLPLALTAAACFFGPAANFLLRRRGYAHAATLALASAALLFLIAAHQGLVLFSPTISSAQLADALRPQLRPQDLLVIHGEYESGSTLGFYLRRNDLHILEGRSSNLWYGSFFPDAPKIFETRESIARKWTGPQRIFLWEDPHDEDRDVLTFTPKYVIASSGGKQIISNQPNR